MSMDVTGKGVRLWISEREKRDGTKWYEYNVGCSKKRQDGSYANAYMKVKFDREIIIPDGLPNGTQMDFDGFMTADVYPTRDGEVKKPMIYITSAKFHDLAGYEEVEEDVPF